MMTKHLERHRTDRIGWLRAAVLGANDGIVSTASLLVGVAAAHAASSDILVAGVAGLVAGAMSMAAGEYVSVSSQADTEKADLDRERKELATDVEAERNELASIYVSRGLEPSLARQVAEQLMAHDALAAHARDELGISDTLTARPVQAALASAASFAVGAAMPLLSVLVVPTRVADFRRGWKFNRASRATWRTRSPCGWGTGDEGCFASHVLGSTCDGANGWGWRSFRSRSMRRLPTPMNGTSS